MKLHQKLTDRFDYEQMSATLSLEEARRTRYLHRSNRILMVFFVLAGGAAGGAAGVWSFAVPVLLLAGVLAISEWLVLRRRVVAASSLTIAQILANIGLVTFVYPFEHYLEIYRAATFMIALLVISALIAFRTWQLIAAGLGSMVLFNLAMWFRVVPQAGTPGGLLSAYVAINLALLTTTFLSASTRSFSIELITTAATERERAEQARHHIHRTLQQSKEGIDVGESIVRITNDSEDSISTTRGSVRMMRETAHALTGEAETIRQVFEQIAGLRNGLEDAVGGTMKRATATRETLHAVSDEMQEVHALSNDLNQRLQSHAVEVAQRQERIDTLVGHMHSLVESNQALASVTSVISDIAQRTHVLAMNALIVAARAGSQGSGFAVVAHEVRELAGQAATQTEAIDKLVADSSKVAGEAESAAGELRSIMGAVRGELDAAVSGLHTIHQGVAPFPDRARTMRTQMKEITQAAETSSAQLGEVGQAIDAGTAGVHGFLDQLAEVLQKLALVDEQTEALEHFSNTISGLGSDNKQHIDALFASLQDASS